MTALVHLARDARDDCFRAADDGDRYPPIADYAVIGDCRTLALISRQGSIDWLCLPAASGPSVFAALLDRRRGGRFAIRPTTPFRTERRYLDATNVMETNFITASGRLRLTDLMVLNGTEPGQLQPERELLRVVEGVEGAVELEVLYDPRPDYARARAHLVHRGLLGWVFEHRAQAFRLLTEITLEPAANGAGLAGRAVLRAGERRRLSMSHATRDMMVIPPMGDAADERLERTSQWWRDWSAQCRFGGPHREVALRSALALKLLTYGLSGAVLAAATTSLPEAIGGARNYDYRFCWLRDAATTLRAFSDLGFGNEGRAYLDWLLHSTRLTRPRLMVFYDVHGRSRQSLRELGHLEGYRGSMPVRIGNDAGGQLQHDVYGSAITAAAELVRCGGSLARDEQRLLVRYGRQVCATWREPDSGLWEVPGRRRHYVHSKLLCWSALNELLKLDEDGHLRAPSAIFEQERQAVRTAIEEQGYLTSADGTGSYVGAFGEDWVDASLLVWPGSVSTTPTMSGLWEPPSVSGGSWGAAGCCYATDRRWTGCHRVRGRSASALSGLLNSSHSRAGPMTRRLCSIAQRRSRTTSGCSPRNMTRHPALLSAMCPKPSAMPD